MDQGNRDTFVGNIVSDVEGEDIDGVDFDWEYPGVSWPSPCDGSKFGCRLSR